MWRATFIYSGCLSTITLLPGLFPAKGSFVFLSDSIVGTLPAGAGTYAFATFNLYYSGTPLEMSYATLNGVACFPSFHTAAALI